MCEANRNKLSVSKSNSSKLSVSEGNASFLGQRVPAVSCLGQRVIGGRLKVIRTGGWIVLGKQTQ